MHFGLASTRIVTILISAVFRGAALIREEALIRGRRLFDARRLLEEILTHIHSTWCLLLKDAYPMKKYLSKVSKKDRHWSSASIVALNRYLYIDVFAFRNPYLQKSLMEIFFSGLIVQPAFTCLKSSLETPISMWNLFKVCSNWRRSVVFIVNLEQISYIALVFLVLTEQINPGWKIHTDVRTTFFDV